jgi:hypothetical protein
MSLGTGLILIGVAFVCGLILIDYARNGDA